MNIKDSIRDCYGKFIGSMDWNIFGTFTHLIPRTEKYNRRQICSFYEKNSEIINRMFFVIERHKESKYFHTHFLLKTPSISRLSKSTIPYRRFIDIDLKIIDKNLLSTDEKSLSVGYYLTKGFQNGVDYEFLGL
jgi:hypothetical protein